jgi:tetratricopeptide (TPR) repeat protein
VPAAALAAAAALALLPMKGLGWAPYDYEAAWAVAHATQDVAKLEVAADLWPAHPDVQREAGLTFWERGDRAKAAKCLHRIFLQEPLAVAGVMDEIWSKDRPPEEFESLVPPTPAARAVYAGWLAKRGQLKESLAVFDRGVAGAEWFDYYAAQLNAVGQWGLEASVRDRRLALKSDAWAHGAAAQAWLRLGAHDRALERVVTASRVDPANPQWPGLRGAILESKGDRVGAVEAYTAACGLAPSDLEWRKRRGLVALSDKTYASAEADFREVLRSRPQDRDCALGLARALAGQGQSSSARIHLDDWLRKFPGDGEASALREALPR